MAIFSVRFRFCLFSLLFFQVGFGNVAAETDNEKVFTICMMIIAGAVSLTRSVAASNILDMTRTRVTLLNSGSNRFDLDTDTDTI